MNNLAFLYHAQGRYGEAEPVYQRALKARERVLGNEHPDTLSSANNLAGLYFDQGRYGESEPLYRRALEGYEEVLGREHPGTLASTNNLAELYQVQGRYSEAEPLYQRALEGYERVLGREHPDTLSSVNNLARLFHAQSRYGEAEPLRQRALEVRERVLGREHPDTLSSMNSLALLYQDQGRYDEAEPIYQCTLKASERVLGKEHPDTLRNLNNLAGLYETQGRHGEAEPLYKGALEASEWVLGEEHPDTLTSVSNLALLYQAQGRHGEAEPLFQRALEARERVLGEEHPNTLSSVSNLAGLCFAQGDWSRAAGFWRRSTAALANREQRGALDAGKALTGKKKRETEQLNWQFWGLVKVVYRLAPEGRTPDVKDSQEMFETAQWAQISEAAASLTQMAARGAGKDVRLARLVRERQDLSAEWQRRDGARNEWLGQPEDKRNHQAEAENNARLVAIDTRIAAIDGNLAEKFPDYAALVSPTPLSVEEAQVHLAVDEALVLLVDTPEWQPTPEETFVWVVTKTDMRWVRSELGTESLAREVAMLRYGLDPTAAQDGVPFALERAHNLYKALFGQVEDLIKDKSLIVVPSGALTQLPFQVLVMKPPVANDYTAAAWLARDAALTVLPAVSSLKALRHVARPSAATKPMIGFGNPLLDGDQNDPIYGRQYKILAGLAREKQHCRQTQSGRIATLLHLRSAGVLPMPVRGVADAAVLKLQTPLPDTADELCAVARHLRADPDDVLLGARATEREVKNLSASGVLAQYRIVHFATHGVLAGELNGVAEPGLILTPPSEATEEDDGYLSASEIAALKLDADWVILSACNTAAGGATSAEALSGLARAFFYAHARALLVSHWAVNSDAAVKLITSAVSEMASDKSVGRAEALRRAMLALIDKGTAEESHPSFWAPFVVVGEGRVA